MYMPVEVRGLDGVEGVEELGAEVGLFRAHSDPRRHQVLQYRLFKSSHGMASGRHHMTWHII